IFTEEKTGEKIPVFTTRADTLFGVTYLVLAPEHPLVERFTAPEQKKGVRAYIEQSRSLSEIERLSTTKEKTGVFTGSYCINPINGNRVPIWIADYVLLSYGTGAVMAVPGHDQRDWEFANKFDLEITEVIKPSSDTETDLDSGAFVDNGVMVNSGEFDNLSSEEGAKSVTEKLKRSGTGNFKVTFKLRDWLISRQRYWGTPIPIIRCQKCGDVAVPEKDLPILLPEIEDFKPTDKGKSPLAKVSEFLNTKCPGCGGEAERETDTMDTFVDSSWYFLRYVDPEYKKGPWNPELVEKWLPVDMYIGGAEHAVMHLMYARYFCMFLHDIGLLLFEEPFPKLRHQGMITNRGAKISKSKGNVINPDHILKKYGSDTLRIYLMFMGSYEHGGDWDDSGINGVARFLARVYRLIVQNTTGIHDTLSLSYSDLSSKAPTLNHRLNSTIKRVTHDIESLEFNTAVAALMELVNDLYKPADDDDPPGDLYFFSMRQLILLLAPMAPHLAEELWHVVGGKPSVFDQDWPAWDESALLLDTITMVVQINGKLRGSFIVPKDVNENDFTNMAIRDEKISRHLNDKQILKKIFVPGRLLNIVAK
ncbi:MAG: class I tRNA ligase family protein, partial [candidate division Zixibacteria bacterium]